MVSAWVPRVIGCGVRGPRGGVVLPVKARRAACTGQSGHLVQVDSRRCRAGAWIASTARVRCREERVRRRWGHGPSGTGPGRERDRLGDVGWAAGEPATNDLFRDAVRIDIGGVDESATRLDEPVELGVGPSSSVSDPKVIVPQTNIGYGAAAASQSATVHVIVNRPGLLGDS